MSGQETRFGVGQVGASLTGQDLPIDPRVADEHGQALLESWADDLAILDVYFFGERDTVRKRPGVTLSGNSSKLVRHGDRKSTRLNSSHRL